MGETWIVAAMITHDAYHAGEINHLRSILGNDDRWRFIQLGCECPVGPSRRTGRCPPGTAWASGEGTPRHPPPARAFPLLPVAFCRRPPASGSSGSAT